MGKSRFNAKARQVVKTTIDDKQTAQIKLDFSTSEYGTSDPSNPLVLPSKKRKTKIVAEKKEKIQFLSKAHRKRLEKIVEKKKKKENRAALLESLSQVQASQDEVMQMTAISTVQTMGLRRINDLNQVMPPKEAVQDDEHKKFSSIAGAKKRLRLLKIPINAKKAKNDPNVVGLEESSSSEDSEDETEDESSDTENGDTKVSEVVEKNVETTVINVDDESVQEEKKTDNTNVVSPKENETRQITDKSKAVVVEDKKPPLEHPTKHVVVKRDPKVQVARLKLPILGEEQRIMELINENEFIIVAGETGSGKTTQIPQFLYEAGYAEGSTIAVTEPRRVAAVAMAARVGHELALPSSHVSYLMRFEGNATKHTKIKFMTDGVLLKELQSDFLLSKYSVVILDEAHERSVYTDILLGLLSRVVPLRRRRGAPLRLVVMSATLRVEDFTENRRLFKVPPPVIMVEARQFPVTVHFSKHTPRDYLKEAFRKTVKIHTRLPDGGVLIFVTGQQEVKYLVRKLKAAFPYKKDVDYTKLIQKNNTITEADAALDSDPEDIESSDDEVQKEMKRARKARIKAKLKKKSLPKINLDDYDTPADDGQADLVAEDDSDGHLSDTDSEDEALSASIATCRRPLWALPLYSMLGSQRQARVFAPPPPGARLCVVATDVAETSLTIPDVRYVVDAGKKKMRLFDHATGASAYRVVAASRASAEQRSGRAGRTAPGHAYRLYSAAVFQHDCPAQYPPDVCRRPVDDLVLQMKCMGIDKVVNFPFPTAPDRMQLRLAERRLETLGLLERHQPRNKMDTDEILKVTPLGKAAAAFPLLPRFGKMLALSHQRELLPYAVALVAALSVPEPLSGKCAAWAGAGGARLLGDAGALLRAVGGADFAQARGQQGDFCRAHGLRETALKEIRKLRRQLSSEINLAVAGARLAVGAELPPPTDAQARLLRQLLLSALGDQVARKVGLHELKEGDDKRKFKYAYHCGELEEPAHMHSESLLRTVIPEWVVYQELYETGSEEKRKMVMKNVTAIEPEWLPVYVPKLCNLGDPLEDPAPRYDPPSGRVKCHFKGTFGKANWELPTVEIDFPERIDRYKWFARFLLEGAVFEKLKKYTASLLSPPSTMVKSWAKLQPRTEILLKAMIMKRTGCKDSLTSVWKDQPKYLLAEYLNWIPESAHNEVSLSWPPL